ncbi:neutral zinc metallopeptidase [Nocardioides pinisoli]|uniref:Neutral zinc metallopeptidase n=1 Tax=Nocardioides pinisoli TaxID=2950279 RepID=A0ABT1L039_9ACTN|nr:neutral zinc metallopeptidase [Nocardioides pinisoli]MCP3423395.1 neutral zinc metallopeptidase [Nocardioides pinisoli]
MKRTLQWSAAFVAGTLLPLGLVGTAATAAPAPSIAPQSERSLVELPAKDALEGAVAPSECGATLLDGYIDQLFADMSDVQFAFLVAHQDALLAVPTYDALFFGTAGDPDYALDSHAAQLRNTYRDLQRFWDIESDDIQLMAMHSDSLLDATRIARTLEAMVDTGELPFMSDAAIATEAQTVATFMQAQDAAFQDNPLWTLNAYAFSAEGETDPIIAALPDKLVFGDGILAAYDAIGLGDVGPRVIMAHEFAHHVQFELGTFDNGPSDPAEATRRTELMADAMASYYATHKRGLALNSKRVTDALLSFYTVGDCSFASPGHHGTPLQRERAADWGADLAAAAQPRSLVLPAERVIELFEEDLAEIISG